MSRRGGRTRGGSGTRRQRDAWRRDAWRREATAEPTGAAEAPPASR
ncbi:MAG TPA: hypothetical protein VF188_04630 [Longimicrobiales bacterium]